MSPSDSTSGATSPLTNASGTDPGTFSTTDLAIGTILKDRYKVVRELSRGGFGRVFVAADQQLHDRPVVIKIKLDHAINDPWFERKFTEELRALTIIDHPGIVGALDSGRTEDGKPFLVMQYIEGSTLRSIMEPEGMPLDRVANIVRQVGNALGAAHDKGIWHRDLKPENIMLQVLPGGDEHVKLIDFGIATIADLARKDTRTRVAGSLHYMAPEQISGQPSAATDVYAFGVIAYEMITGRKPFTPDDATQLSMQQRTGVRLKPTMLRPEITGNVERLILQALNYNPADRPQKAPAFGDELAHALADAEATRVTFKPLPPKRNKLWITAAAVAVSLALGASILYFSRRPAPAQPQAPAAPPPKTAAAPAPKPADDEQVEIAFWNTVSSSADPRMYREYLAKYPQGRFADLAKIKLDALTAKPAPKTEPAPPPPPASPIAPNLASLRAAIDPDEYSGPLRGEMVWAGKLEAGGSLTIQAGHAPGGFFKGDLPRVPVTLDIISDGAAIVEQPSAANHWDRVVVKNTSSHPVNGIVIRWRVTK